MERKLRGDLVISSGLVQLQERNETGDSFLEKLYGNLHRVSFTQPINSNTKVRMVALFSNQMI